MEIDDSCYSKVNSVLATTDAAIAFAGADVVVVLGGFPRSPGMERKDLTGINAKGMHDQALALNKCAHRDCKVLVVANPCNTNCLVMSSVATNIPKYNFTGLTRLDQERLAGFVVTAVNERGYDISFNDIRHVFIWGNHSSTQVPDVNNIEIRVNNTWVKVDTILEKEWLENVLIPKVQKRGAEIIQLQGASSGMSAANAIAKHLRDWLYGPTRDSSNQVFSMGISSDNNPYNIPPGLIFSLPCRYTNHGDMEIVPGYDMDASMRIRTDKTIQELLEERRDAEDIIGIIH